MQKRQFTEEFKRQALELAKELGSVSAAAKQLGISDGNLYNWRQSLGQKNTPAKFASTPVSTAEENHRLRKENAELKKVNLILKQAAAFFSQDQLKSGLK